MSEGDDAVRDEPASQHSPLARAYAATSAASFFCRARPQQLAERLQRIIPAYDPPCAPPQHIDCATALSSQSVSEESATRSSAGALLATDDSPPAINVPPLSGTNSAPAAKRAACVIDVSSGSSSEASDSGIIVLSSEDSVGSENGIGQGPGESSAGQPDDRRRSARVAGGIRVLEVAPPRRVSKQSSPRQPCAPAAVHVTATGFPSPGPIAPPQTPIDPPPPPKDESVNVTFVDCFAYFPGDPSHEHRAQKPTPCPLRTPIAEVYRAHAAITTRMPAAVAATMVLVFRGRRIFRSSTPSSLAPGASSLTVHAYRAEDYARISAQTDAARERILASTGAIPGGAATDEPTDDAPPAVASSAPRTVTVRVKGRDLTRARELSVAADAPLVGAVRQALGEAYADACLRFDGDRVAPGQTAADIGIEDDDLLELV